MEGTHNHLNCCIIFLIFLCSICLVKPEVYTVGDQDEWSSGTNYLLWSQRYNFSIGDVLVFNYVRGQHNMYEVTEGTYRSCDASSGVLEKYESGHDQVILTKAKKYWFICNISGHCLGGMKFGVHVKQAIAKTNISIAPNSGSEPTPTTDANGFHVQGRGWARDCIVAFGILLMMIC